MPIRPIDFRTIRPHNGSQHTGFEEFCCQLALLDTPTGVPFHRKGTGADSGVECYRVEPGGTETAWQAKYFFEFGSSEASQLTESFENALSGHPALTTYIVCMPHDLSDGRIGKRKSERQRWDGWVTARVTSAAPRQVTIQLWGAFELTERLGRSDALHAGRRAFWFDTAQFGTDWFIHRFDLARAALGKRYTPELNIELPIGRALAAFARAPAFIRTVEKWADRLEEMAHSALQPMRTVLIGEACADVDQLETAIQATTASIRTAATGPADKLPISEWQAGVTKTLKMLDRCTAHIWDVRTTAGRDREQANTARHFAWRLHDALTEIDEELQSPPARLANSTRLLVTGDAGVGKSHLLADVVQRHIELGLPAILVLGGWFSDREPWTQIAEHLGLTNTPPDEILSALDASAEAAGARALVIVDAINERQGISVWAERLSAFLEATAPFPRVAVVVSCRTTFVPYIVSDALDEAALPRIEHPGFAGHAAEAARRYLDQRGIVRMAAPHLAPEFENPLFLRTCCDLLERRGERELPKGLAGVTSIFEFYFAAIADTLTKRMRLFDRLRIVERALEMLTDQMVEAGVGYLPLGTVISFLDTIHQSHGQQEQSLFFQLENEGVITVEPVNKAGVIDEQVRFTFERISDHRIAARLLDQHATTDDPTAAFAVEGPLHVYVAGEESHRFAGIAEALSIQLPERFGIELLDVVRDRDARWDLLEPFRLSLLWRRQETFTERTLELVEEFLENGFDETTSTLFSITTEPANIFNADYLDKKLRQLAMPDRDVHWSVTVTRIAEREDNPVDTLIEWTLANGLDPMDETRARLTAIALSWLLSLSHRAVRDKATKALATLLVRRRTLATSLVQSFAEIDDPYVVDRVLAAAYGAAMRNHSNEGLAELTRAVFNAVFAREFVPNHALIRDHARGIVELAAKRGVLPAELDLKKARPPYGPGSPIELIPDELIEGYVQDYGRGLFHDDIYSSTIRDGDFARYVIDRTASQFLMLPIEDAGRAPNDIYEEWRKRTIMPKPERMVALERVLATSRRLYELPYAWNLCDDDPPQLHGNGQLREEAEADLGAAITSLEALLGHEEVREFHIRARSYLRGRIWSDKATVHYPTYEGDISRRWVGWRAHELGWTAARFADFENATRSHGRMEHRIERIGKKYQWIALHELVGRLADLSAVKQGWPELPGYYDGPWQIDIREMDPSMLVTSTRHHDMSDQPGTWWSPHAVTWRRDPPAARRAWMADKERDVPDPVRQIEVTDPNGRAWLVLDISISHDQWVMSEGERTIHRMTWHKLNCMLVARVDALRLIDHLSKSKGDRDHPFVVDLPSDVYLGEYLWHPSCAGAQGDASLHAKPRHIVVHATVVDRHIEHAGYDYSIENTFNLSIPAPTLMSGMDLRLLGGRSLGYVGPDDRLVFKDPSAEEPGFSAALVDRAAFLAFLEREQLQPVWIFSGEKSAPGGRQRREGWGGRLVYWGVYTLSAGQVSGKLEFNETEPDSRQLKAFLAAP